MSSPNSRDRPFRESAIAFSVAFSVFVSVSLLNLWLQRWIGYQAIALVYLLAVVLLGLFLGRSAILFGTTLTALGWDFLFVPPRYSFHIAGFYDKMMLAMYFVVALTVGQLTALLRRQRLADHQSEERATALYLLTRELADSSELTDALEKAVVRIESVFHADVAVLLPRADEKGGLAPHRATSWCPDEREQAEALGAFQRNQPVESDTDGEERAERLYLPLSAGGPPAGVLALRLRADASLSPDQRNLLDNFVQQTALVLDRQRLREAETNSRLLAESERLSRTLLNSVSHELRTPLAAITSAANTLRSSGPLTMVQQKLAVEMESASARLNRVVQSLLSAARLQSGQLHPRLDWCDILDVVRVALRNTAMWLAGRPVQNQVPAGLPLVKADFVLLEQAVGNLLLNAATHTPPGTPVQITARKEDKLLVLEIADRGPGLPPEEVERIFDLFHRAPNTKAGGTGLGLAIVKGFIEAQGGTVRAANRPGGGAQFSLSLSANETPKLPQESA